MLSNTPYYNPSIVLIIPRKCRNFLIFPQKTFSVKFGIIAMSIKGLDLNFKRRHLFLFAREVWPMQLLLAIWRASFTARSSWNVPSTCHQVTSVAILTRVSPFIFLSNLPPPSWFQHLCVRSIMRFSELLIPSVFYRT
jgi:hypothetical protein